MWGKVLENQVTNRAACLLQTVNTQKRPSGTNIRFMKKDNQYSY